MTQTSNKLASRNLQAFCAVYEITSACCWVWVCDGYAITRLMNKYTDGRRVYHSGTSAHVSICKSEKPPPLLRRLNGTPCYADKRLGPERASLVLLWRGWL